MVKNVIHETQYHMLYVLRMYQLRCILYIYVCGLYSEFSLIRHRFIRQTFQSATISQYQYNVRTSTNEYPVNLPNSLIHSLLQKQIVVD